MIRVVSMTLLRYGLDMPVRWWPRVRRYGSPWRAVYEIDWLRLTLVVRR